MQWVGLLLQQLERIFNGTDSTAAHVALADNATQAANADKLDTIDSTGFLQLASAGTRKINWGGGVISLTASNSGNVNITHNLGVTPQRVVCQLLQSSGAFAYLATGTYGSTTFNVSCLANSSITGNINFDWFAVG